MNYQEAKVYKANLEAINDAASKALQAFDSLGKSEMGMTPDHVKAMPEYQATKKAYDISFNNLRNFNGQFMKVFMKVFKKEVQADRKAKYAAMTKASE